MEVADKLADMHLAIQISRFWPNFTMLQFGERVGHVGGLIGPKLVWPKANPACTSSMLCEFIYLEGEMCGKMIFNKFEKYFIINLSVVFQGWNVWQVNKSILNMSAFAKGEMCGDFFQVRFNACRNSQFWTFCQWNFEKSQPISKLILNQLSSTIKILKRHSTN